MTTADREWLRVKFAMFAPPVPTVFAPVMRPAPPRDELASTPEAAEQTAEFQAWQREWVFERLAQWPWAYADMVLARMASAEGRAA